MLIPILLGEAICLGPGNPYRLEAVSRGNFHGYLEQPIQGYKEGLRDTVGFPGGSAVKNLPAKAEDVGLNPGSGRSLGGGNGNPLQYSWLGNPMNRGAGWARVHGISKTRT